MNYEQARKNMVDSQIHPMGVVDEPILAAFESIPREKFVDEALRPIVYCDEDLPLGGGRCLMEAQALARLIQAAAPRKEDVALIIGAGCGYAAAIMSLLVTTVIAIDSDEPMMDKANAVWQTMELMNIVSLKGELAQGSPDNGPYDLIILNGGAAAIPDMLKAQLAVGGRLVGIRRESERASGKAVLVQRVDESVFSERILFDANVPYLPGLSPKKVFVF